MKLLLKHKDIIHALTLRNSQGDSPLDYVCTNGHLDMVTLLVNGGSDVNSVDERGWGSLHNSCSEFHRNSLEIVEFLLDANADPLLVNSDGQTPYDITKESSIKSVLEMRMKSLAADSKFLDGGDEF